MAFTGLLISLVYLGGP